MSMIMIYTAVLFRIVLNICRSSFFYRMIIKCMLEIRELKIEVSFTSYFLYSNNRNNIKVKSVFSLLIEFDELLFRMKVSKFSLHHVCKKEFFEILENAPSYNKLPLYDFMSCRSAIRLSVNMAWKRKKQYLSEI